MVWNRRADGTQPALLARTGGDPTDLAAAVALADADAELPFEALPLLEWKRCRARGHEPQRRQVGRARPRIGVEQHADGGGIAGSDGRVMLLDVIEKPAAGKFPSHDQSRAASKRRQRAQGLGRTPVVGAKIVDAIGAAYAKGIRGRL